MEIWKYGNMEIWKYVNMEIWKFGTMEMWEYVEMWKCGKVVIGKSGNVENLEICILQQCFYQIKLIELNSFGHCFIILSPNKFVMAYWAQFYLQIFFSHLFSV